MSPTEIVISIVASIMAYFFYSIRAYHVKVNELDARVTKVETIIELLGDIKKDLHTVRTDVEVIKSKLN